MDKFHYVLSFLEGILTFVSPCILPMLPIYFVYLAGESSDNSINKNKLLINSFGFVIGFTIIFVILGATATTASSFLRSNLKSFRIISGAVMILFGLNFMGIIRLKFLNFQKRINYNVKQLKFLSSIVFGAVFSFAWTPCVGAFLGSALIMASNSDTVLQGTILLLVYSLGLGIPFMITALAFNSVKEVFTKIKKYNRAINIVSGIVLIIAGILVLTDNLGYLSFWAF